MPVIEGLSWTFDTVTQEFDKWSPTYNKELYEDLFAYKKIDNQSKVLEIGIGTGQATVPVLQTGCHLTAVELGKNLSDFCRIKFNDYPNFSVENTAFENFSTALSSYDLIYSAGAFHWIPEELGYRKVFDLLKPGGVFARCTIHPDYRNVTNQENMWEEIQVAYKKYYDSIYPPKDGKSNYQIFTEEQAQNRANLALKYGFIDTSYKIYYRNRSYSADDYVSLISIYSDVIALPEKNRQYLCADIKKAIEAHGGTIVLRDMIDIEMAKKEC